MKAQELRKKSEDELTAMLAEMKARIVELGFSVVAGNVKNVREIRAVKKEIARIATILQEQEQVTSV